MSILQPPSAAKLVIGLFTREMPLVEPVAAELTARFGPIDIVSPWLPFDYTDYYEKELGRDLKRRMFSFARLISQTELVAVKEATNALEQEFSDQGRRRVNIDPGYLLMERFVLATGKNFTHRIYLDRGIYADLTLIYTKNGFETLPWTYPDYADQKMLAFLSRVRAKYRLDLKKE